MVTTDHISPAGSIQKDSPTGEYFMKNQVLQKDLILTAQGGKP